MPYMTFCGRLVWPAENSEEKRHFGTADVKQPERFEILTKMLFLHVKMFFHSSVRIFRQSTTKLFFLMDNYCKTICRIIRRECSSCRAWIDCLRCRICSSSLWLLSVSGRIYYRPPRSCRGDEMSNHNTYPLGYLNPPASDWHRVLITRDLFKFVHLRTYPVPSSNI